MLFFALMLAQAPSLLDQAKAAFQRGQRDSAYIIIQRAADAEPNNAQVQFYLGEFAGARAQQVGGLRALGIAKKSKAGYGRAVALEPTNPEYLEGLIGYLSIAPGIAGGDRDSAYRLALALRRVDDTRGMNQMINVLWRGNDRNKRSADSIMDAWAAAHNDRAGRFRHASYFASTNRPERALAIHEQLLAADPNDVVAKFGVARNLVVLKRDPRRALMLLQQVAAVPRPPETGPTYQPVGLWHRMGQAYVMLGIRDSARIAYTRALDAQPGYAPARAGLDSLGRRP